MDRFHEQGLHALKMGDAAKAVELLRQAPPGAEAFHDLGLAYLSTGDVGRAAWAQRQALALEPGHAGARAQLASVLQALGDDAGAAEALETLLAQIGPNLALSARLGALRDEAARSARRRLVGGPLARVAASPLVGKALARTIDALEWRAPFATLSATPAGDTVARLELIFASMDASLGRVDLAYGGTTQDEHGRRVPLDEFTSAGVVFLSEALGVETSRVRRLLAFLLTEECGLGPLRAAGCDVGWTVHGGNGSRRYGLFVAAGR